MINKIRKPKRTLKLWALGFVAWLVVFMALMSIFGFDKVIYDLRNANFIWVGAAIICFLSTYFISCFNWRMLSRYLGVRVKFSKQMEIMLAGIFIDDVLPNLAPGGEFVMGYLLHRESKAPLSRAFASVMMQSIVWFIGFISIALFVLVLLIIFGTVTNTLMYSLIITSLLFSCILFFIFYLAFHPKFSMRLVDFVISHGFSLITKLFKTKQSKLQMISSINKTINSLTKVIKLYFKHKFIVALACTNMFFFHFMYVLSFYFLLIAFNVPLAFEVAAAIFLVTSLVSLLSLVPGQLGVFEGLSITFISLASNPVTGLLVTTIARLIYYWTTILIGGLFAIRLGLDAIEDVQNE